ncbi:DUF971 domain-containing protein [uncultured Pseudoteredinibacter sp.]|uniref:DUF971 domain-containing protein n=1 Tax=uncultured Pseudoteredinibacter sp. TaxID=1641701 RepID=UPI00260BC5EC|nr:DUF971 domain-containing protein [uncultured Pseudoteredinibacter sp.]
MHEAPKKIEFHRRSQELEVIFSQQNYRFSAEFLRVHSPSAEVKGHGPGQEVLQHGKQHVAITDIEANGHYAIRITFDDGHDSGIYSWAYLAELGQDQESLWQCYLDKLAEANLNRDPDTQVVKIFDM